MNEEKDWNSIPATMAGPATSVASGPDGSSDPLDTKVGDVDTSYTLLRPALYDLAVKSVTREPNREKDGERLTIAFATTVEAQSDKGAAVPAGFTLKHYIALTPKQTPGKQPYTVDSIRKSVARLAKAAGVPQDANLKDVANGMLIGKVVRCKVVITPETNEFDATNKISQFVTL